MFVLTIRAKTCPCIFQSKSPKYTEFFSIFPLFQSVRIEYFGAPVQLTRNIGFSGRQNLSYSSRFKPEYLHAIENVNRMELRVSQVTYYGYPQDHAFGNRDTIVKEASNSFS